MSSALSLHCHPPVTPVTAVAFLKQWLLYGTFRAVDKYSVDFTYQPAVDLGVVLGGIVSSG